MTVLSDDEFRLLLDHLDRPWSGYRKVRKGVKKRLRRHMTAFACTSIQGYLHRIDEDPTARARCEQHLAVTISRFFRDRRLWDHLQEQLLPDLAMRFSGQLSAWSAGCANGEEPYSLSMLAQATAETIHASGVMQILATDAEAACLDRARQGRYPESSLKEVPETFRQRWFRPAGRRAWQIDGRLGADIHWQTHQLLAEPPNNDFHLILLRNNLLTYYQGLRMQTAFDRIVDCLKKGGILIVGSHERPPPNSRALEKDSLCPWVYWRREDSDR